MMRRSNTSRARVCTLLVAVLALLVAQMPLQAAEPKVPARPAPDGIAVAILGPGVDYREPLIADRLARDGEGDLISWDFADGDNRPFEDAVNGQGTPFARAMLNATATAILVIVREKPGDPQAFGHMMSFVAKTPARIVVWPGAQPARPDWPILIEATKRFRDHLFIIPRDPGGKPASLAPLAATANVVIVDVTQALASGAPPAAPVLLGAAARAVDKLTADANRPISAIAADIRNEIAGAAGAWTSTITPNRPR